MIDGLCTSSRTWGEGDAGPAAASSVVQAAVHPRHGFEARLRRCDGVRRGGIRTEQLAPAHQQRGDELQIVGDAVLELAKKGAGALARFRQVVDGDVEAADDVELERGGEDEDAHGNDMRSGEGERPIGREEQHPGDQRAHGGDGEADADSAEQSGKQDRGQEGHRAEAFAEAAEQPAKG